MSALPEDGCHGADCPECQFAEEEWEVESGWRCRECRTQLPAPMGKFGFSRLCKACTKGEK